MISRKWWFTTLLVLLGTALCVRLGIWQFERLDQRRVFNMQVETMRAMDVLELNKTNINSLDKMEWRAVKVTGEYDFVNQVALRNRYNADQYGYHLLTPLRFDGTAVLVDRGWVPAEGNSMPEDWRKYDESGMVSVKGHIRLSQTKPVFGGVADVMPDEGGWLTVWNNADVEGISRQMPYSILDVYIQPEVDLTDVTPPLPFQPTVDLTEGSHFGYALQWFTFATILIVGYPFYLRIQE